MRAEHERMSLVKPAETLLVIDVGNTRVGMAICDVDGLHNACHVNLDSRDAWRDALEETWTAATTVLGRAVVIASVSPGDTRHVSKLAGEVCGVRPLRVGEDIPLPMPLDIENKREVGVDRVCAAAAAFDRLKTACAVASFGTATTVDCVSADGRFLGGAILPGIEMCCAALHEHTAALPRVTPGTPVTPFGKNTHDAIVNGLAYGAVGALREIVERFAIELREWPQLIITGGSAPLVTELADFVDAVVPDLCLMGVALAYRRAAESS